MNAASTCGLRCLVCGPCDAARIETQGPWNAPFKLI